MAEQTHAPRWLSRFPFYRKRDTGMSIMEESPPGFIFERGAYICVACGCLCPDSWTILQAHKDFHEALAEALAAYAKAGGGED